MVWFFLRNAYGITLCGRIGGRCIGLYSAFQGIPFPAPSLIAPCSDLLQIATFVR